MIELIEKTILTGMGVLCISQKKSEELIQELKERFNVSEEEGREFFNKLQESAKENQGKLQQLAQDEVRKACERVGMVSREEFEKLEKKVEALEKQLKETEA